MRTTDSLPPWREFVKISLAGRPFARASSFDKVGGLKAKDDESGPAYRGHTESLAGVRFLVINSPFRGT